MTVGPSYSAIAPLYIDLFGDIGATHPDDLAFIEGHLGGAAGPVLDAGCGPGHLTDHLHRMGVDAWGLDLVPEFVDHARAAHPRVPFRLGSLHALDVADHSLAGILAWFSLIHMPPAELAGALAGFHRALAPGGTLVVGFCDGPVLEPFAHKVTTAYRLPADEMAARLADAGFVETGRMQRPAEGTQRPIAALAATARHG